MLEAVLNPAGYLASFSLSGEEALERYKDEGFDVVLADITMKPMDGITLLKEIKKIDSAATVIMMTGYASTETAMQALKFGAFDYVQKPFRVDELVKTIKRAVEEKGSASAAATSSPAGPAKAEKPISVDDYLIGESAAIKAVEKQIQKLLSTMSPVLIQGERGTGKRTVAKLLHDRGKTQGKPMEAIACRFVREEEFRDAIGSGSGKPGPLIEGVKGGTLLLAEVETLPLKVQEDLANILQISGSSFRLVCTTTANLESLMAEGKISEAFYFKVGTLPLVIPPLRERAEDILAILNDLLKNSLNPWFDGSEIQFTPVATDIICNYAWPGNVTEMRNLLCAIVASARSPRIGPELLPLRLKQIISWPTLADYTKELEDEYLGQVVKIVKGDHERAREITGLDNETLEKRLKYLGQHQIALIDRNSGLWSGETLLHVRDRIIEKKGEVDNDALIAEAQEIMEQMIAEIDMKRNQLEREREEIKNDKVALEERANFLEESENTIFEKGQNLTEIETQLEQREDELSKREAALAKREKAAG